MSKKDDIYNYSVDEVHNTLDEPRTECCLMGEVLSKGILDSECTKTVSEKVLWKLKVCLYHLIAAPCSWYTTVKSTLLDLVANECT